MKTLNLAIVALSGLAPLGMPAALAASTTLAPAQADSSEAPAWRDVSRWAKLRQGMTTDEVKALLGAPTMDAGFSGESTWTYTPIDPTSQASMAKVVEWMTKEPDFEIPSGFVIFQAGKVAEWSAPETAQLERLDVLEGRAAPPRRSTPPGAANQGKKPADAPANSPVGGGSDTKASAAPTLPAWLREDVWDRVQAEPTPANVRREFGHDDQFVVGFPAALTRDSSASGSEVVWKQRPSAACLRGIALAQAGAGTSLPTWIAPSAWLSLCQSLGGSSVNAQALARRVTADDVLALLGEPTRRTLNVADTLEFRERKKAAYQSNKGGTPEYWVFELPGTWEQPIKGVLRFRDPDSRVLEEVIVPPFEAIAGHVAVEAAIRTIPPQVRLERVSLAAQTPRWGSALLDQVRSIGLAAPTPTIRMPEPDRVEWRRQSGVWECAWELDPGAAMTWRTLVPTNLPHPKELDLGESLLVSVTTPRLDGLGIDSKDQQKLEQYWGILAGLSKGDRQPKIAANHAVWQAIAALGAATTRGSWTPSATKSGLTDFRSVWTWSDLCEIEFLISTSDKFGSRPSSPAPEEARLSDLAAAGAIPLRVTPIGVMATMSDLALDESAMVAPASPDWSLLAKGDAGAWVLRLLGAPKEIVEQDKKSLLVYPGWKDERGTWAGGKVLVARPPLRRTATEGGRTLATLVVESVTPPVIVGRP